MGIAASRRKASSTGVTWKLLVSPSSRALEEACADVGLDIGQPDTTHGFVHSLAKESVQDRRARLESWDDGFYLRLLQLKAEDGQDAFQAMPLHIAVGPRGVVSWSRDSFPELDALWRRYQEAPRAQKSTASLISNIADALFTATFPFLDHFHDEITELEPRALKARDRDIERQLFGIKGNIIRVRQILASERDVIHQLAHQSFRDGPEGWDTPENAFYVFEAYDHVLRLFDSVDMYREMISAVIDSHLAVVSNHLNEIVKTLTLVTTVLLPASLVSSLWGTNFAYIPGAHHRWGFYVLVGVVLSFSAALILWFRRKGWF